MELKDLYNHILAKYADDGWQQLFENKPKKKVLLKIAEELGELQLAIIQHLTKNSPEENIQEELIDVFGNLNILAKYYDKVEIENMFAKKLPKMYKVNSKYIVDRSTHLFPQIPKVLKSSEQTTKRN